MGLLSKFRGKDWQPTEVLSPSISELYASVETILTLKKCECGANDIGVTELLMTGNDKLMVQDTNSKCKKCKGLGVIDI